jgi:hypothetical protein
LRRRQQQQAPGSSMFALPFALASDPMLAAEGVTAAPTGLYVTSTESGQLVRMF